LYIHTHTHTHIYIDIFPCSSALKELCLEERNYAFCNMNSENAEPFKCIYNYNQACNVTQKLLFTTIHRISHPVHPDNLSISDRSFIDSVKIGKVQSSRRKCGPFLRFIFPKARFTKSSIFLIVNYSRRIAPRSLDIPEKKKKKKRRKKGRKEREKNRFQEDTRSLWDILYSGVEGASVDGLRDAGRLERMAVINQLPRWAQLARRRGIREERNFSRTEISSSGLFPRRLLVRSVFSAHSNLFAPRAPK